MYVAVHVFVSCGASETGAGLSQVQLVSPRLGSCTKTLPRVVLPSLLATTVYVTTWPTAETSTGSALFVSDILTSCTAGIVRLSWSTTSTPSGSNALAWAWLRTEPASRSACVVR